MALDLAITLLSPLWLEVPGPSSNRDLIAELERRGHRVTLITNPAEVGQAFDGLIPRWIWQGAQLPPAVAASLMIERGGARSVNLTTAMLSATDKRLTKALLVAAGIAVPRPYDGQLGKWICKPAIGSMGGGIITADEPRLVDQLLENASRPYLVEEYVPDHQLWRVIASPTETLGSYRWTPVAGSFSALGADYDFLAAPTPIAELAQAMVAAVGGDLMGCDILEAGDGQLYALEVNGTFGLIPFAGRLDEVWVDWIERHLG